VIFLPPDVSLSADQNTAAAIDFDAATVNKLLDAIKQKKMKTSCAGLL
jgi:hypothetical protein